LKCRLNHEFSQSECLVGQDEDEITLQLDRLAVNEERSNRKFNSICYGIAPEDVRPPRLIEALQLIEIRCTIDDPASHGSSGDEADDIIDMGIPDGASDGMAMEDLDLEMDLRLELDGVFESFSAIEPEPHYHPKSNQNLHHPGSSQDKLCDGERSIKEYELEQLYEESPSLITSHLLESAFYIIFHGPSASPPDVIIQGNTMSRSLCYLIPSVFNPEYLKVSALLAVIDFYSPNT
jgi:hypothetical protein